MLGIFIAERGKENLFAKVRHNEVSFKGESPELVRGLFNHGVHRTALSIPWQPVGLELTQLRRNAGLLKKKAKSVDFDRNCTSRRNRRRKLVSVS